MVSALREEAENVRHCLVSSIGPNSQIRSGAIDSFSAACFVHSRAYSSTHKVLWSGTDHEMISFAGVSLRWRAPSVEPVP